MKKRGFKLFLISSILTFSFVSCKKATVQEFKTVKDKNFDLLQKTGFNLQTVVDKGSYYIIERDIIILKKDLTPDNSLGHPIKVTELSKAPQERPLQAYETHITPATINIYIDDSNGSISTTDWNSTIIQAVSDWNGISNFGITFNIISSAVSADITVINGSVTTGELTAGALPSSSSAPGSVIYIDLSQSATDASLRRLRFVHEIGHTIGLRHTDYYGESGTINDITGTVPSSSGNTNPDVLSVFNTTANQFNGQWNGFSDRDILAIRNLYALDNTQRAIYRYSNAGKYIYTTNWSELGYNTSGWDYEKIEGFIFNTSGTGKSAVYRYYKSSTGDHFYTQNYSELGAGGSGYSYENIIGYAYTSNVSGTVPLYRFYRNNTSRHFYTRDYGEGSGNGFIYEGIMCYVIP